jgi:hypothetical protein
MAKAQVLIEEEDMTASAYPQSTLDRFWLKVTIGSPDECWPWTGTLFDSGYGAFWLNRHNLRAHRFAYEISVGAIQHGVVMHKCDNRICCNPRHLRDATDLDNIADRDAKGRQARGEKSAMAKLTAADIIRIRDDRRHQREIAKSYGVCKSTIGYIKRGEYWRHIPTVSPDITTGAILKGEAI